MPSSATLRLQIEATLRFGLLQGKVPGRVHLRHSQQSTNGLLLVCCARKGVLTAEELRQCGDGEFVRAAGCVIARQRPGTAKGFIFISMEDETGITNVIVTPDLYDRDRLVVTRGKFLLVQGKLQNQDGVIHVKAAHLETLSDSALDLRSHDFH